MDDLKGTANYVPEDLDIRPNRSVEVTGPSSGAPEYDVITIGAGERSREMLVIGLLTES